MLAASVGTSKRVSSGADDVLAWHCSSSHWQSKLRCLPNKARRSRRERESEEQERESRMVVRGKRRALTQLDEVR